MPTAADARDTFDLTLGTLEPSHLWVLGLAREDDGSILGLRRLPDSSWAECQCPDDCQRDHGNE